MSYKLPVKVFDFFAGCGGSGKGFADAGMDIVFALDNDLDAKLTYEANMPNVHYELTNIQDFDLESLAPLIGTSQLHPILFCGCAPCQPFTKQNTIPKDVAGRRSLLGEFQKFVEHYEPELVFVENVPGMQQVQGKDGPFDKFITALKKHHYHVHTDIVVSQNYGVPQRRRRLVLVASRLGSISFPPSTHGPDAPTREYSTVKEWINYLPEIEAGQAHPNDSLHRAAKLSATNLERIMSLTEGQDRKNWPDHLKLACHENYDGHIDVYGRMWWNRPASGLTTRCISLSNGRFGHPEQNRAISVREAARLQTFPKDYVFHGSLVSMARQIGNAVPVLLAQRFGEYFNRHIQQYIQDST